MKYERIEIGRFIERPNRFIAYVEIAGKKETVHVKNTGRCAELLTPNASVYVQRAENPDRKTQWDLIGVKKGKRMINMDSQIPNKVVEEWIKQGNLFPDAIVIRPEKTYRKSRFDLYVEEGDRKIFVEVKGVTLEENGIVKFPDAPTERGIKHIEELCEATKEGYEAYIFFVIQMKGVRYFTPNMETQPAFGEALKRAKEQGVHVLAYDCKVGKDSIEIGKEVPVLLEDENLKKIADPLVEWYRENKRELPWREQISAYRVWVSEIMLQQSGGGEAVLCPIFKCASDSKGFGGGGGRPALEVVGRSWILQPCAEHAESGKADHGRFSWRISQDLRGDKKSYRNRKLYGGSNQLICIWDSKTGGRWQCTSCGFEDHGKL